MTLIGNVVLALAALVYALILYSAYGSPPSGTDAALGHAVGSILLGAVFGGLLTMAAVAVGWTGGLNWTARQPLARYALVAVGLLVITGVTTLSLVVKFEPASQQPFAVLYLTGIAPGVFPLVLLGAGAILLNAPIRSSVPEAAFKVPLALVFGTSLLACSAAAVEWMVYEQQNAAGRIDELRSEQARQQAIQLADIDATDPLTNMASLLGFTDRGHPPEVRERALARVRSNPAWQAELVGMLEGNASLEAFTFLASNAVEDRAPLAGPVNTGILHVADWVRRSIRGGSHAAHFYDRQFYWEVERVLATADAFRGLGVDYLPAVRALRAALDEPNDYRTVRFTCRSTLDRWIAAHEHAKRLRTSHVQQERPRLP